MPSNPALRRDEALLESLRQQLQAPELAWAEPPRPGGKGAESIVLDLVLRNAGEWSGTPLVARLLQIDDVDQLAREAAVQGALADAGFPAPRPVARGPGRPGILQPFLLMERIPGRVMFSLVPAFVVAILVLVALGLGPLGGILVLGWYALAVGLQLRLHAVSVDAIERGVAQRGLDPSELGTSAWVERIGAKLGRLELQGLEPGVAWLRSHTPKERPAVICHGDYWPGNVLVSLRGVTGLIDWPSAAIAPPEFDLGWNRVQDAGDLAQAHRLPEPWRGGLGELLRPLAWIALLPHRWLYRLFRSLDDSALDYYAAFHCLRMLIWSYEQERADDGGQNPWSSKRARALLAARFAHVTGIELELPQS